MVVRSTARIFRNLALIGISVSNLSCEESSSTQGEIKPCGPIPSSSGVPLECQVYCERDCELREVQCDERCAARLETALTVSSSCESSAKELLLCLSNSACSDGDAHVDLCAGKFTELLEQCGGAPIFPGMQVCWAQCSAVACGCGSSNPYLGEGDCLAQCQLNLGLDLNGGCYGEAITLRSCVSHLTRCGELELIYEDAPNAACFEESWAWRSACEEQG